MARWLLPCDFVLSSSLADCHLLAVSWSGRGKGRGGGEGGRNGGRKEGREEGGRERERDRGREGEKLKDRSFSSYEATVLLDEGPTLMTSFNLNYLLYTLSSDTVTLDMRASTCKFWTHIRQGWSIAITVLSFLHYPSLAFHLSVHLTESWKLLDVARLLS